MSVPPSSPCLAHSSATISPFVGDPVSVVTGAVVDVESDFHLADAPFAFSFGRSYDSTYRLESSEVGSGFRHTFDVDLRVDVDGFSFFDPHLRGVGFPFLLRDGDSADRSGYTLRRLTDRRYRVETKKGFVFELELARAPHARSSIVAFGKVDGPTLHARSDASGRIVGLDLDPHRSLAFDYVGASLVSVRLLTSAEKPRVLCRYVYDTTGRLREAYDPYGHAVRYAYDAQLRLCTKAEWETACRGKVHGGSQSAALDVGFGESALRELFHCGASL